METNKLFELQTKHVDIIQSTINRFAQNSFVIKGWSVTIVSAIFAFVETQDADPNIVLVAFFPAFTFWMLDAYYLRQERLYRCIYKAVSADINSSDPNVVVPLDMSTTKYKPKVHSWWRTMFSSTVLPIPILIGILMLVYFGVVPLQFSQQKNSLTPNPTATSIPAPTSTPLPATQTPSIQSNITSSP